MPQASTLRTPETAGHDRDENADGVVDEEIQQDRAPRVRRLHILASQRQQERAD